MRSRVSIALMVIALALLWNTNAANAQSVTCPSPTLSCASSSSGTLSGLSGTFACTAVYTDSSGTVHNGVLMATLDGSGNYTASMAENSNDTTTSTTFSDFGPLPSGTYCVNTDGTGYLIPTSGCPLAFVVDNGGTEVRIIDTTEGLAGAEICTKR